MPEYKQLFSQEWNVKPHRGRQRKTWGKGVHDIFLSLGLDKCEWLERKDTSLASFMSYVRISKRDLLNWLSFGKNVEFRKYLHGVSDAGTRLFSNTWSYRRVR